MTHDDKRGKRDLQKKIDEYREACYARQAEIEKARNPARTLGDVGAVWWKVKGLLD